MYCKKCNINFKKDKRVCTKCGAALQPGEVKSDNGKRLRNIIVIASASVVVVVAAFLIIFFVGRVPNEVKGTWYEAQGYGTAVFYPNGVLKMTMMGTSYDGSYTFSSSNDSGTINFEGKQDAFTCDGKTLSWAGSTWTLTYVNQVQYNFDDLFNNMGK